MADDDHKDSLPKEAAKAGDKAREAWEKTKKETEKAQQNTDEDAK